MLFSGTNPTSPLIHTYKFAKYLHIWYYRISVMKKSIFAAVITAISYFVLGTNNAQAYSTLSDLTNPVASLSKAASPVSKQSTTPVLCLSKQCTSGSIEAVDLINSISINQIITPPSLSVALPTATPSSTPTQTIQPSAIPTDTPAPDPTTTQASPSITQTAPTSLPMSPTPIPDGTQPLNADIVFNLINQTRTQAGLPAFQKDDRICAVAASRAPELYSEIMVTHTMHAGFYARNLPYWATENIIYMRNEQQAVNWWLNSPIHRAAIYGNSTYSCVACSGNSCSEIFTNFESKIPSTATPIPVAQITSSISTAK